MSEVQGSIHQKWGWGSDGSVGKSASHKAWQPESLSSTWWEATDCPKEFFDLHLKMVATQPPIPSPVSTLN